MPRGRAAKSAGTKELEELQAPAGLSFNAAAQNEPPPAPGIRNQGAVADAADDMAAGALVKRQAEGKAAFAAAPAAASAESANARTYVVQAGDTLFSIAKALLGDGARWPEIVKLNPGLNPENLQPGQAIKLPAVEKK